MRLAPLSCLVLAGCWSFGQPDELAYSCLDDGDCVAGYRCIDGLCSSGADVAEPIASCMGCAPTPTCPEGMVRLGGGDVCIDAYEATSEASPTCDGERTFGVTEYDFPNGFPPDVEPLSEIAVCPFGCAAQGVPVYACSRPGRLPTQLTSWNQASRACANVGKRLCRGDEWVAACAGPQEPAFPHGSPEACAGEVVPTGTRLACEGGYDGLFDMIGNTVEWRAACTQSESGAWSCAIGGSRSCSPMDLSMPPHGIGSLFGYRCCADL